jgi:hypothetical protein
MKSFNLLLGALVVALAISTAPALAGPLLAGVAGVALMAGAGLPAVAAPALSAPLVQVVEVVREPAIRVVELDGGGVVVFKNVGGKLTSRFYRA